MGSWRSGSDRVLARLCTGVARRPRLQHLTRMDEEQALEALSNVISALSETPFDLSLHGQHIQLALATGMDEQIRAARDTLTAYYACGDDVWLPLIEDKKSAADLETIDGALSVLAAYKRAEDDYLCTLAVLGSRNTVV
jgi:hypothetical protein